MCPGRRPDARYATCRECLRAIILLLVLPRLMAARKRKRLLLLAAARASSFTHQDERHAFARPIAFALARIQKDLHLARFNFHFFHCARDVLRHGDLRRSSTSRLVRDQLEEVLLPVSKSRSRSAMASSSWPWLYGFSTAEEPLVCKAVAHRDPKLLQALDAECGGTDPFCIFCRFESNLPL